MMADSLVDVLRRLNALEQRSGQVYDQIACTYVPLTTALSEIGGALAGAALNVGAYTVGPAGSGATYTFAYPTVAKAIQVLLAARWAAANDGYYAYLTPNGGGVANGCIFVDAPVGNISNRKVGAVNLDGSALAQLVVAGANSTALELKVLGYYI